MSTKATIELSNDDLEALARTRRWREQEKIKASLIQQIVDTIAATLAISQADAKKMLLSAYDCPHLEMVETLQSMLLLVQKLSNTSTKS